MLDVVASSFSEWRAEARRLLRLGVRPDEVFWREQRDQGSLFADDDSAREADASRNGFPQPSDLHLPKRFIELAEKVSAHVEPEKWGMLYRAGWRIVEGERHLLDLASDELVMALLRMEKAVRRDVHKMHAFVRFRQCSSMPVAVFDDAEALDQPIFVAWYRPDHRIVRLAAPFFRERFASMRWAILTPHESAYWDGRDLQFGEGLPREAAPQEDELEDLWRTYYRAIFNPARIKLRAMQREMPTRFWDLLPETAIIEDLLREAPARIEQMIRHQEGFAMCARDFFPEKITLPTLKEAAAGCEGCDLHRNATQTVFGEGPKQAALMLVGEQPGDQEDIQGKPFVGPAGRLLDASLKEAGIDRDIVYITNAVKHFSFEERGKRRIHKKPTARQVGACRPWLEAEISVVQPAGIVCLGATAAQALIGRDFRITQSRGQFLNTEWAGWIMATYHPSALLRAPDETTRDAMVKLFTSDLRQAAKRLYA